MQGMLNRAILRPATSPGPLRVGRCVPAEPVFLHQKRFVQRIRNPWPLGRSRRSQRHDLSEVRARQRAPIVHSPAGSHARQRLRSRARRTCSGVRGVALWDRRARTGRWRSGGLGRACWGSRRRLSREKSLCLFPVPTERSPARAETATLQRQ